MRKNALRVVRFMCKHARTNACTHAFYNQGEILLSYITLSDIVLAYSLLDSGMFLSIELGGIRLTSADRRFSWPSLAALTRSRQVSPEEFVTFITPIHDRCVVFIRIWVPSHDLCVIRWRQHLTFNGCNWIGIRIRWNDTDISKTKIH